MRPQLGRGLFPLKMNDMVYRAMVTVLVERRNHAKRNHPTVPQRPRRKRPTTLRSVRNLLLDDHYALLKDGNY